MRLLILSIAVLWTSPWLYGLVRQHARVHAVVERVLLVGLALMVIFNILPDSWRIVGWPSLVLAALGMLLPSLFERAWGQIAEKVHWVPLLLGTLGLALHASLDGAAFVDGNHHHHAHTHALPYAVVLHRFFEGMFVWWTLKPRFGTRVAAGALLFITLFTLFGYAMGDMYFHQMEEAAPFALFQALVAGSLLHLAIDRHGPHDRGHGHGQGHGQGHGDEASHQHHHHH